MNKTIVILVMFGALLLSACPQKASSNKAGDLPVLADMVWQETGDLVILTAIYTDFSAGHKMVNTFTDEIGDRLKQGYENGKPLKVVNPQTDIELFLIDHHYAMRFMWSVRLVQVTASEADYFFASRGTLCPGSTPQLAYQAVQNDLKDTDKVNVAVKSFLSKYQYVRTVTTTAKTGAKEDGKFYYLEENFIIIGKDKKVASKLNSSANTYIGASENLDNK